MSPRTAGLFRSQQELGEEEDDCEEGEAVGADDTETGEAGASSNGLLGGGEGEGEGIGALR